MKQSKKAMTLRLAIAAAVVMASAIAVAPASAADACLSAQAEKNLAECPAGKLHTGGGKAPQVSFSSAPQAINLKKGDAQTKPKNPTESMSAAQRDLRQKQYAKKSRQLLVTEIQGLESLFKNTPKKAADRPKLMRRLAEGYVELENAAFRDMTTAQIKKEELKKKNPAQSKKFAEEAKKAQKILTASRDRAIKYYSALKSGYPKWCQTPNASDPSKSQGCTDEVLYYLAYEYEQAKKLEPARKVYFELIQNWPNSKYIPNAYLAFGELFFQDAQSDPSKWQFAEQSYLEVIKYPPPDNKVFGYAHYKLGYVYWNQGEHAKAMSSFKKTIDYGMQYSNLPNAAQLAVAARRDIIPVYALSGDPKAAYNFFKPISGDTGGNEKTFKMMYELGMNYLDTGKYPEGIALFQDLKGRDKGERFCVYQGHITEATLAMKSGDKGVMKKELDNQMDTYQQFVKQSQPDPAKLKCANVTAGLLTETAMAWHLEAVGSGGVRGTGDENTMRLSAQIYQQVVDNFTQEQFAKFTFPRIIKEDWPNIFKIKYAMADLLYFQKDWEKCGPAFDSVVEENPNGPEAPEAAYASVLCYQKMYLAKYADGSDKKGGGNLPSGSSGETSSAADKKKFAPKELTPAQQGMVRAFNRYVCYIKPKEGDKTAKDQYVEVKYARARTYFEAQHWEEAALAFREVALNHSDHEVGIFASQLYLESTNVLGTHADPPRPTCYSNMADDVPKFIDLYCKGGKEKDNADQCEILFRIQRDIERLAAQKLVEAADAEGGVGAARKYKEAADRYMVIWEKYGQGPCEAGEKETCAKNEEILYNAAKAYQAARLVARAIAVRRILINPKYNLHETTLARKAVYEIGGNYQAIAVYDEAAKWYEKFAEENPKMEEAPTALSDATILRLGLGQEEQAIKNADLFNRNYGGKQPAEAAQIAFAVGAHYVDRADWANARKRLSSAMGQIDRNATLDVQVQAHALLGRVEAQSKNDPGARREYQKVVGYWRNPDATTKQLDAIGGSETEKLRRLSKVLTAVGEAYFFFAEEERKNADKITFPEYKGSGQRDDVLKHINTKVKDWISKKRAAIEKANGEYLKVVNLQPSPPPRWVIASGARVGQLWGKFVAEFRAAPIPKEWKGEGMVPGTDLSYAELRGVYYDQLDAASEPQKQQAKSAYKTCLSYSVKYQHFDEFSRACEEWLSKNYPAEYSAIDEFRGAPTRVNSGLNDATLPLMIDGTPYVPALKADESEKKKPEEKPKASLEPNGPAIAASRVGASN